LRSLEISALLSASAGFFGLLGSGNADASIIFTHGNYCQNLLI
jgi:hypothetical protein